MAHTLLAYGGPPPLWGKHCSYDVVQLSLLFSLLQVQAFGNVYGAHVNTTFLAFSSVYDCEGYFDIATWMGTFVAVVVIIMFYFATLTLFSMQTVDRFDDPRGRTISVENLH